MSQVRVSGNASGTGILTVTSPNTNSNYTLTLPANTGTLLSSASTGAVLKVQQFYNIGNSTASSTLVSMQTARFSYTPVSTNSTLYFIHSAYTYMNPAGGFAAGNCYGYWALAEYNGSTDVQLSSTAYMWNYNYSSTYMQSIGAQSTLQYNTPNTSTTTRLFNTVGAVNYASYTTLGVNSIYLTVIEVAN